MAGGVGRPTERRSRLSRWVAQLYLGLYKKKSRRKLLRQYWPRTRLRVDGYVFDIYPADNATEHHMLIDGHLPERSSLDALLAEVSGKSCLIFDIGANCGIFSVPLADAGGPTSQVIAFEPNPEMRRRLARNLYLNGLSDRVRIEAVALGAERGVAELNIHERNLGQSSLRPLTDAPSKVTVEVRPLLDYVINREKYARFVIKIDVEGLEDKVLMPFLQAASQEQLPDAILIEVVLEDVWSEDVTGFLTGLGYQKSLEADGNILFVRDNTARQSVKIGI